MTEKQVMEEVRKFFQIRETRDEFLGTFSTTRASTFFVETPFLDTNLTYIDYLAIKDLPEDDLLQIANLPRLSHVEGVSIAKLVYGDEADGSLMETINHIDHRLINKDRSTYTDYMSSKNILRQNGKRF